MSASSKRKLPTQATGKKKISNLDGDMVEKVRRLLNAKTDTEAIQRALQKTVDDYAIQAVFARLLL